MPVTYDQLATTTLGGAATTISLSGISQSYTDLRLVFRIFGNNTSSNLSLRLNSNTGTYRTTWFLGSLGGGSGSFGTQTEGSSSIRLFQLPNSSSNTDNPYVGTVDILNYRSNIPKGVLVQENIYTLDPGSANNSNAQVSRSYTMCNGVTAAVTSIEINGSNANSLQANSQISLYGILRA